MSILNRASKNLQKSSKASADPEAIRLFLDRGVEHIYPSREFLEARLKEGKQLTMYLGIDPTGPTLHLGHYVILRKLRQFANLGHKVILLIGGFTGMIGDPTDKSAARVRQTKKEVDANAKLYASQAKRVCASFTLKNNYDWLHKLTFENVIELAASFTVQQMLVRDMFDRRMKEDKPIYLHEFLYPLMQGYDSVHMNIDGEIGGNDQTFNMLAGRSLMKAMRGKEKFVMSVKLLTEASGKKMGKTENAFITLLDSPTDIYGKIMSWSDGLIAPGFELLTDEVISQTSIDAEPKEMKMRLAFLVVSDLHGEAAAQKAQEAFVNTFSKHETPEEMPTFSISAPMSVVDLLVAAGLCESKSDARRQIDGAGVKLDGEVVHTYDQMISSGVLQKGKRHFVRVVSSK